MSNQDSGLKIDPAELQDRGHDAAFAARDVFARRRLADDRHQPAAEAARADSDQKGCYVGVPIDDTLLKTLQSGKILTIAFKSLEKKEITIPIALSGFKEAYAKLM